MMMESIRQEQQLWDLFVMKDEYGRRVYNKQYSPRRGDAFDPCVSKCLVKSYPDIRYPGDKPFAVCLTHDVDDVYPPLQHTLLSVAHYMKRLDHKKTRDWLFWKSEGKQHSPYWNFRKLMQIEERLGVRSSFYFLATDRDVRRFRYNIEDLSEVLGEMADNGWEVGLHGGYYAFDDPDEIKREKTRLENALGSPIIGYRNHYLQFKVPDTWRYLADAGFKYDTTIGYGDMIGFRNGMCHPYRPYDLHTGKEIDIMEIPLAIMDGALFDHAHTYDEALHSALRLVDTTAKYHGVITLLWHNSMFSAPFREHWAKLYVKLLEYCKAKNAWMTTGEEIWKWSKDH
jgi:hypothetical protein